MRLSSVVKKILEKEKRVKIVILGLDNAGKTSLLRSFIGEKIEDIPPTFGYQLVTKKLKHEKTEYTVEILDIGGQETIRSYWDTYYSGADGVVFVYDNYGTDQYKKILESVISHPTLRNSEFICAANKCDVIPSASTEEKEAQKEIKVQSYKIEEEVPFDFIACIEKMKISTEKEEKIIPIISTSAKTGNNVERLFLSLLQNILKKRTKHGIL